MIVPDVNILIYAYNSSASQHKAAKAWWEAALTDGAAVGLAWVVVLGFVRLSTSRRVMVSPMTVSEARAVVLSWLERPNVRMVTPGEHHAGKLFDLLEAIGTGAELTTDAHIAALALEYRAEVVTTDADFARFPGVRHLNPLVGKRQKR